MGKAGELWESRGVLGSVLIVWTQFWRGWLKKTASVAAAKSKHSEKGGSFYLYLPISQLRPTPLLLQTRNNCDVTNLSPRHHEVANVLHITRGKRRNHDFYTSRLPFRGQYFAEQKSMSQPKSCLTTRSSPCYFGVFVVPISYLSHDIFFKERVDFLETLPFATSTVYSCL